MKRLLALAVFAPAFAFAQDNSDVSYDYFDLDYVGSSWDVGAADLDASGLGGKFSIDIRDQFFLFGGYHEWEFDGLGDAGSVEKTIGAGKAFEFGERWSIYGGLGIRLLDLDVGLGNLEDEGALAIGGARLRFGEYFEVRAGAEYADIGDTGLGETSISIGGDLHLTDVVALAIELSENEEEVSTLTIGVRFYPSNDSSSLRQRR
jgi:hypothetical protein